MAKKLIFKFAKVKTQDEYDQMTELMNHLLDLDDEANDYVDLFWGMCQDLVNDFEEKMEVQAEVEGEEELKSISEVSTVEEVDNPSNEEEDTSTEINPKKVAYRGKKRDTSTNPAVS